MKTQRGIAVLLLVLFVALATTLIVATVQSRVLLSVIRTQSQSDDALTTYAAETEVGDTVGKLIGNFPPPDPFTKVLTDGTKLSLTKKTVDSTDTYTITSSRPYAVSKLEITKKQEPNTATLYDRVEIVLSVDCTGSMKECASGSGDDGKHCARDASENPIYDPDRPERIKKAKDALLTFVDEVISENNPKTYVGLSIFRIPGEWVTTLAGEALTPTNNWAKVKQAVNQRLGNYYGQKGAQDMCAQIEGTTSIGTGLAFIRDYFKIVSTPKTKKIGILVTDGQPNSRIPDADCPPSPPFDNSFAFCPLLEADCTDTNWPWNNDGYGNPLCTRYGWGNYHNGSYFCQDPAVDFMQCALADKSGADNVDGITGSRDPETDIYTVTIFDLPSTDRTAEILNNYSTKYYNLGNADQLPQVLKDIYKQIQSGVTSITVRPITQ